MSSHMLKYKPQSTQMLQLCVTILQGGCTSVGALAAGPGRGPLFSWPAAASCLKPGGHEFWGSSVSLPETPLGLFTREPLHGLAGLEGARARAARGQGDPGSLSHPVTPVSKHRTLGWPLANVKREEFMQKTHPPSHLLCLLPHTGAPYLHPVSWGKPSSPGGPHTLLSLSLLSPNRSAVRKWVMRGGGKSGGLGTPAT